MASTFDELKIMIILSQISWNYYLFSPSSCLFYYSTTFKNILSKRYSQPINGNFHILCFHHFLVFLFPHILYYISGGSIKTSTLRPVASAATVTNVSILDIHQSIK